jgi:hypothetical protein
MRFASTESCHQHECEKGLQSVALEVFEKESRFCPR